MRVFAFTYVVDFFTTCRISDVERGVLPLKAWKDCLRCPKFQACDEIAVLRVLHPGAVADGAELRRRTTNSFNCLHLRPLR